MQSVLLSDYTVLILTTYGGGERRVQGFGGETWGKETTGKTQA